MGKRANTLGLPGEQQQAKARRAHFLARARTLLGAVAAWAGLVLLVGPARLGDTLPPVGVARADLAAPFDYAEQVPEVDFAAKVEAATASIALHYAFDPDLVARRIGALHDAFRMVRPRYRLYVADRDRMAGQAVAEPAPVVAAKVSAPDRPKEAKAKPEEGNQAGLSQLEKALAEEMTRLRPEFESLVAVRRSELTSDAFDTLLKAGFSEELELLLADVAQVVLSARIVRDLDRFDDDLAHGVHDTVANRRYDRRIQPEVFGIDEALRRSDEMLGEFARQKKPSRLDEPVLQAALKSMARSMVEPTFGRDVAATRRAEEQALAAVPKSHTMRIAKGDLVVRRGEMVTPLMRARLERMWQGKTPAATSQAYAATAILLGLAILLFAAFANHHLHHFRHRPRDATLLAAILLAHAAVLRVLALAAPAVAELDDALSAGLLLAALPHALGPSLASLFLRPFTAAPFSLLCAMVGALVVHNAPLAAADNELTALATVSALVIGLAGVHAARRFRQRSDLVVGALTTSAVGMVTALATGLLAAGAADQWFDVRLAWLGGLGAASGIICYLLLSAITPIFESLFNRLTDIKLVELASMNHPALRLLATEAPGTFTHSIMVGNLAQAACDEIGANGLLARVGAYYHDLGKTKAPKYFAENQAGDNPHDRLKPHLSALIIRTHVKDGIKILQDYRLPDEIIDFVPQHHGTSLIAHFYHRAQRECADNEELNEADFRYPGPKPQRRETALLMLADAVEAAAKALPDPNPMRFAALVKKIIASKTDDGQFEQCDLTLRELALVQVAFVRALIGIHHVRPVYAQPAPQTQRHEALPAPGPHDEMRKAALLADGGVGTRNRNTVHVDAQAMAKSVDQLDDPETPQAPTAVLVSTKPRSRDLPN